MGRVAFALAFTAIVAACLPSPGLYVAIGLGIAAMGCGLARYRAKELPGSARLVGAAAMTVGALGLLLGALRVVLVLGAIDKIDRMLP